MTFSKKLLTSLLSAGLLLGGSSLLANASETDDINAIKMSLEKRTPPLNAKSIKLSPLAGIYEVYANGNIFYVDKNVSYVMVGGALIEDATKRNLTAERLQELTTIKFDSLPFKNAIEIKKGNGSYKFAVFSDPDCPFCKTLEQGLEKMGMSDYTAYIFLFPIKELHPDAVAKSESIWCAKDKNEAWNNWMVKGIAPAKASCDNPIVANEKLADELGVAGTPTIYMNNGKQTQAPQELVAAMKEKK
ncbi:MAG: DsbC family protein [Methylotenera sp.]